MKKYSISSSFEGLPIDIFWYPSENDVSSTVFVLKGIYGQHDPGLAQSWDNQLVHAGSAEYNFVCINTARIKNKGESTKSSNFTGKTYHDECEDVDRAYKYLIDNKVISPGSRLSVLANSFGGTTLLGVKSLIDSSSSILMIGSGCGKKQGTTKPLLATLPDENKVLSAIESYSGSFAFIRGSLDNVVPAKSQEKIIKSVKSACVKISYDISNADHNLTFVKDDGSDTKIKILIFVLKHLESFALVRSLKKF